MPAARFSNQTAEQVLKHLAHFLKPNVSYNLSVDPLAVSYRIEESVHRDPRKIRQRPKDWHELTKRQKREKATKRYRENPKIRSRKLGRTINLSGWGQR